MKKNRVLRHIANGRAQRRLGGIADILSVNVDPAGGHVKKTQEKCCNGGFARTRDSDQAHALARGNLQVKVFQNRAGLVVSKINVPELDFAFGNAQLLCHRLIFYLKRSVEDLHHLLRISQVFVHAPDDASEIPQIAEYNDEVCLYQGKIPQGKLSCVPKTDCKIENKELHQYHHHPLNAVHNLIEVERKSPDTELFVRELLKCSAFALRSSENFYIDIVCKRVCQARRDFRIDSGCLPVIGNLVPGKCIVYRKINQDPSQENDTKHCVRVEENRDNGKDADCGWQDFAEHPFSDTVK